MFTSLIRLSLQNRIAVLAFAVLLLVVGAWQASQLPKDVFPDLDRPRVVIMVEAHGMAPEEVETLITFPIESVLNGATGVQAVRSTSGVGLAVINVEFDWGTDIYVDRQLVVERLALVADRLPPDVQPQLMPISSLMGQIMIFGLVGDDRVDAATLRTEADWTIRQQLLGIEGVSQVIVMGGDRVQYQVLVDPEKLVRFGVQLSEIREAVAASNANTAGGYLDQQGPHELLVRSIGRVQSIADLQQIVVKHRDGKSVLLRDVARVVEGAQIKRGDSSAFVRNAEGKMKGGPAVVVTVLKQPHADTLEVTARVDEMLRQLGPRLPAGVKILPALYQQKDFIDRAVENVTAALRDGSILVVIVLLLFLMNVRTTFITLTAIPMSILIAAIVFAMFGMSVNTMTLGGLAVAIGELVDDAIVDVENIFRRLRENRELPNPKSTLQVVFTASCEIRNSIVYGTLIVLLVFLPLFALSGMEGRLFRPLAVAYIVSIAASLFVSLTLTPVLSYWLLGRQASREQQDGLLLRSLKRVMAPVMRWSIQGAPLVLALGIVAVALAVAGVLALERDFIPPFNEGTVQANAMLPPGTSLEYSTHVAELLEQRLADNPEVVALVRKTGRAELDEHAMTVNVSEIILTIDPASERSRQEVIDSIEADLKAVPGIVGSTEQPLAHLIAHMLSGVQAHVAIKLFGDDLDVLRKQAARIEATIRGTDGVRDLYVEPQVEIQQLRIEADRDRLAAFGLHADDINQLVATALRGEVLSQVLVGQRTFDLVLRLDDPFRENREALRRLLIELPDGRSVKLEDVANIYPAMGPNLIQRENVRRRIVVQCNVAGRGLVDTVDDIRARLAPIEASLPPGYAISYGGQFENQASASRVIGLLFCLSLVGMFFVLYTMFKSANLALQVMVALPAALLGSVAALHLTGQTLSVAAMVGFISLAGIASRNGILLVNHYLHLVRHEGEDWTPSMIVRAGLDRLAPVLMTALTSGIGLVPLALAAGEPGKEILYPVAVVIIGGLITSTALEFLIRPALFWSFGIPAARRVVDQQQPRLDIETLREF